jgi:sugar transferase (PEP-CTERM/EpsH1 system associated)
VRAVRLLYLTPRFPHPSRKGDQLAAFHRIMQLGRRHDITLVSFYEDEGELEHLGLLREICELVEVVQLPKWRGAANVAVRAAFDRVPLQIHYYSSARMDEAVRSIGGRGTFDVAHAVMLRMAPYLGLVSAARVLDAIDSMELRMRRNVEVERPPKRWLFQTELRRVAPYERSVAHSVDAVLVASTQDVQSFGDTSVDVVPNGVDATVFAPDLESRTSGMIVFSGTMSYPPNVRAATWFADNCFPLIRERVPDAQFVIAGASPGREVKELGSRRGIVVTGFVPSMASTLNAASIAVAPMLSGAGIQNKILEAMACGLPVVTTTIGLGGITAAVGSELLVADTDADIAAAVVSLAQDRLRAREVGDAARARVLQSYTWEESAAAVERVYRRITA